MTDQLKQKVKERYGRLASQFDTAAANVAAEQRVTSAGCCTPTDPVQLYEVPDGVSCCGGSDTDLTLAQALYGEANVAELPDSVTGISLGCGNPTAIAGLKPGETVLDLGSGGGIDCFLAAKQVGPAGHVIGVDMTDSMLALANKNKAQLGVSNVEFRKGEIENLPVDSNIIDVIISNCVINLSPDKDAVFAEAHRVLKPGGRFTVSDVVTEGELPEPLRSNIAAWTGCISGALDLTDYLAKLRNAGFAEVRIESKVSYGLENISELDQNTRDIVLNEIETGDIPLDARVFSANIVAFKQ
jgi:ubiquinone/menaquinone biosynthesis C-methylase UbiE